MEITLQKPKSSKKTKTKRVIAEQELKVQDANEMEANEELGNWEDLHVQATQIENLYPSAPVGPMILDPMPIFYPSQPLMVMDQVPVEYTEMVKQRMEYPSSPMYQETLNIYPSQVSHRDMMDKDKLLQSLYQNRTEIEFEQDYHEFKSKQYKADINDEFYEKLLVFEQYNKELQDERNKLVELGVRIEKFKSKFWKLSKYPVKLSERCPDGNLLTHVYSNEQASFLEQDKEEFERLFAARRAIVYLDIPKSMFLAQAAKIWIKHHLSTIMDGDFANCLSKVQNKAVQIIDLGRHQKELSRLMSILNTLFFFETKKGGSEYEADKQFIYEVRKWISFVCIAVNLSGHQSFNRRVLLHILRTPGVGQWGASMVLFPTPVVFSEIELYHYAVCLKAFLGPVQELEELLEAHEMEKTVLKVDLKRLESEDWIVIDEEIFNVNMIPDMKVVLLMESDYEALICQFNVLQNFQFYFSRLLSKSKELGVSSSLAFGDAFMKAISVCYHFIGIIARYFNYLTKILAIYSCFIFEI